MAEKEKPAAPAPDADRIQQLEELIAKQGQQLADMSEMMGKEKSNAPKRVIEHTSRIMFIGERAVVGWEDVRDGAAGLVWPAYLMDGDGKVDKEPLPYLESLNGQRRYDVEIVSQVAKQVERHQGSLPMEVNTANSNQHRDVGGTPMREFQPRRIVLTQNVVTYVAKVRFLNGPWEGREIEVDTLCLNP